MPRHACSLDHIGKPWHNLSLSRTSLSMLINDEVVQSKPREREMNSSSSFNHSSFLGDPIEASYTPRSIFSPLNCPNLRPSEVKWVS